MTAKLVLEKLPLEPNDILLVIYTEGLSDQTLEAVKKQFEEFVKPRLPHKNMIIISPFNATIQALRPLIGQFKIVNEKLTVCKEEDL